MAWSPTAEGALGCKPAVEKKAEDHLWLQLSSTARVRRFRVQGLGTSKLRKLTQI